jgi:putative oxidoreductase
MAAWANLGKYKDLRLLVTRVGIGAMFVYHGYTKVLGGPAVWHQVGSAVQYAHINIFYNFWGFMAACTETCGGFLLVIGLVTRPGCLLLFITMLVASLMHLATGSLADASHAIEDALLFFGLLFVGPGKYSVDGK